MQFDPITTTLGIVVILELIWLMMLRAQIKELSSSHGGSLGKPKCCDDLEARVDVLEKATKNLFKWANAFAKRLKPWITCVEKVTNCGDSSDPWPPEGPGPFPGA